MTAWRQAPTPPRPQPSAISAYDAFRLPPYRSSRPCAGLRLGTFSDFGGAQGLIDRIAEAFDDDIDVLSRRNEGRCDQHMIAADAVDGSAHGIDYQSVAHGLSFDADIELEHRIERLLRVAVGNQLDRLKETPAADIADMMMIAEPLAEAVPKMRAH